MRGRSVLPVLLAAACGRGVPSASAAPDPAPSTKPTAPAKDPNVGSQQITLKTSSPTGTAGGLTVTLLDLIEIAAPDGAGKLGRMYRAKLHLEAGGQARDLFLSNESTALGYVLKLHSAGDGQDKPNGPRESIVVIDVHPAP